MGAGRAARQGRPRWRTLTALALLALPLLLRENPGPQPPPTPVHMRVSFEAGGKQRRLDSAGPLAVILGPGARLTFAVEARPQASSEWHVVSRRIHLTLPDGSARAGEGAVAGAIQAPVAPGTYAVTAELRSRFASTHGAGRAWRAERETTTTEKLYLCVPVPGSEIRGEHLRGYRVGDYSGRGEVPEWFIEIPEEALAARLSEHLTLGTFVSRDPPTTPSGWPRYAPIPWALVDKVEALNAALRKRGIVRESVDCYSGYRTPHYNRLVDGASRSQHMQGQAMDFRVDENGDSLMDDVDGNGVVNIRDAIAVGEVIRSLEHSGAVVIGGTGVYETAGAPAMGVGLHLDIRGTRASWGRHYPHPGATTYREIPW